MKIKFWIQWIAMCLGWDVPLSTFWPDGVEIFPPAEMDRRRFWRHTKLAFECYGEWDFQGAWWVAGHMYYAELEGWQ